jgi:hypothetical protein
LAAELPGLALEFGCRLPAAACREVTTFMLATECIDRHLDALGDAGERERLAAGLLKALAGEEGDCGVHAGFAPELARHVAALARVVARDRAAEFGALARRALDNTERMRTTRDPAEYVACVEEEGRLTVALALVFLEPHCTPTFLAFFRSVAELGNLADKLKDARADFRRGELALRPGLRVHARLLAAFVRRVPVAAARHPRLGSFVVWGLGWLQA